jgi:Tetratricopeptide repeat
MRIPGYLVGTAVLFAVLAAQAQTSTQSPDRIAYDAAFQDSLKNPSDPATVLRYAEAAVKVNDLEGAISALERLLLINGDQPRVKLELGTLYYRLGSYEAARAYFESARASTRATPEVKQLSGEYLVAIDKRTGVSQFSGDVLAGIRYSTNANNGPTGAVRAFGTSVIANPNFAQRPDFSAVAAANVHHRYDLGRQDSGTLESNVAFYASRQFQVSEANVMVLDLNTGPRMKPFGGWAEQISVRPFIMGRYVAVDDMTSYWSWGAGAEASVPITPKLTGNIAVYGQQRQFVNNWLAPFNNESTGVEAATFFGLRAELLPNLWVNVGGNVVRYTAAVASQAYWEFGAGASATVRFTDPIGINGRPWEMTANAYVSNDNYDQPSIYIDPTTVRTQTDIGFGLALSVPLDERFSLTAQAGYAQRAASISNYSYNAFTTLVGVGWRF